MKNSTCCIREPNAEEKKEKERVTQAAMDCRARLLLRQPFIGMLGMRLDIAAVKDSRMRTACTDGKTVYIDIDYFNCLEEEEDTCLLAHEIWHCVLRHFLRKQDRERIRFNYAADLEVDFLLEADGFRIKDMLPHEWRWKGRCAEEIYEKIDLKKIRGADRHCDTHVYPEDPEAVEDELLDNSELIIDPDLRLAVDHESERQWRNWVVSAAQSLERRRGNLPGHIQRVVDNIYKPGLDWREVLQQFVTEKFGGQRVWLPPARRYLHQGLYIPGRKTEHLSAVIAVDTSGSTCLELPEFLGEFNGIVNSFGSYQITLIQCDTRVQNVTEYSQDCPMPQDTFEFSGFGGTDFRPVFRYIEENVENPELVIFLTDGQGPAPVNPPEYPVLWVLTEYSIPPASWGLKTFLKER